MSAEFENVIAPPSGLPTVNWKELRQYRDLFLALVWRDIAVRYKQTALGSAWAIVQPLVTMVVFTFVFNGLGKIESGDGTPYPVFLYVGLLAWQYFAGTLTTAANSMVTNAGLIQKVYFPRLVIPATAATSALVDLGIASLVLAGMMVYYGLTPRLLSVTLLPLLLVTTVLASMGVGLLAAAANVKHRDVRHAVPFVIQVMMYVTPVMYPATMLDSHPIARTLMLWLNPISAVISNARALVLGRSPVDWSALVISLAMSCVIFIVGLVYFRRAERYFADLV